MYTRSPSQDSRLFGPRPWKVLAATYETNRFLSNPDPGENLVMENLVMEIGAVLGLFLQAQEGHTYFTELAERVEYVRDNNLYTTTNKCL